MQPEVENFIKKQIIRQNYSYFHRGIWVITEEVVEVYNSEVGLKQQLTKVANIYRLIINN